MRKGKRRERREGEKDGEKERGRHETECVSMEMKGFSHLSALRGSCFNSV